MNRKTTLLLLALLISAPAMAVTGKIESLIFKETHWYLCPLRIKLVGDPNTYAVHKNNLDKQTFLSVLLTARTSGMQIGLWAPRVDQQASSDNCNNEDSVKELTGLWM